MALPVAPIPKPLPPPMGGMGGMAAPSPNPGKEAAGLGKVRQAIDLLNSTVSDLQPGTPIHEAVIKAIGQLSKHAPPMQAQPGAGMQGMKDLIMKALQGGPAAALQRSMAGGAPPPMAPPAPGVTE